RGVPDEALALTDELLEWLEQPVAKRELTELEKELLERIDLVEARDRLRMRLAEQRSRQDRGNRWVGTAGTSPHGSGGTHPTGIKVGQAPGGRGALEVAGERRFRDLRSDVTLDTRHIEVALRRLRAFVREGAEDELDIEGTIDKTARNAGELELKMRPPRRSNLRVLLLLDVGGSMDPHADVSERLFSSAKRATHFKELRTYYFHNCVYGRVYETAALIKGISVLRLLQDCDPSWRLIRNCASGNFSPSIPMNGMVPPSPNAMGGFPKKFREARSTDDESHCASGGASQPVDDFSPSKVTRAP